MTDLVLTDEIVLPERDVIIEERSSRTDSDPASLLVEQMMAALYLNHPYGIPIIGWRREMEQLTREDALAFYKLHYAPDNAILIVAGDVTLDEVLPLAKQHFGGLKPAGHKPRVRRQEPPAIAARRVSLADARVSQPQIYRMYLAPNAASDQTRSIAMQIATEILGGGETSWLYRKLVVEEKIAVSAGASYDSDSYDDGTLAISAIPAEGVTLEQLEARVDAILAEYLANGPSAEEFERARTVMRAAAIYARDNQATMARIYGFALVTGQSIEDVEQWEARVGAATLDQVKGALAPVLVPERSVTGLLLTKSS